MAATASNVTQLHADPLLKWTARLAEGLPIDWTQAAADLSPALLASLRQVAALAGSFAIAADAPQAIGPLGVGSIAGDLRIAAVLGEGSYGTVYRAHDERLDRDVALKVFKGGHRQELLREGQLLARIDHPNVLKVYGAVETDSLIGFVSELLPGESLEQWLGRQGKLSASEITTIGGELCAALCALHQGNIVHGDLKPANVLRHRDGRWVVADFGSSQYANDPLGASGTPLYMAPERFTSTAVTASADQYSLGVLLFFLATRSYPYSAETVIELKAQHRKGERRRLMDLRPDLPRLLIDAIERALATDPKKRHSSCGNFAAALHAAPRHRLPPLMAVATAAAVVLAATIWWPGTTPGAHRTEWLRTSSDQGVEILSSGATARVGDALALHLTLTDRRYVYVINEDLAGAQYLLFPLATSTLKNPLDAGSYRLPDSALDWRITSRGGREHFFVLLSDEPIDSEHFQSAQQAALDAPGEGLYAFEPTRGVGGLAPATNEPDAGWLAALKARHRNLEVRRFELINP